MTTVNPHSSSGRRPALIAAGLLLLGGAALAIAFGFFSSRPTKTPEVTADVLAAALLQEDDVAAVKDVRDAHPSVIEFNGHLDNDRQDTYRFYVARVWLDPEANASVIQNTITAYASQTEAEAALDLLAEGGEALNKEEIGDATRIYFYPEEEDITADLVYRFSIGAYAVKVQVSLQSEESYTDAEAKAFLQPIARALAKRQEKNLRTALKKGRVPTNTLMDHFPKTLSSTELLGTAPVTAREWRGLEHNLDTNTISGFKTGALRRFQLTDRPDEVVEIVAMEFDSAASAKTFQQGLTNEREGILEFPADLAPYTIGIREDDLQFIEAESVYGPYLVDVTMMSPFGELDTEAALQELPDYIREAGKGFQR